MTALRPIGALDLPNLIPADLAGRPLPMLEWLDVDELWVDPSYQRDIGPAALRMIARLVEGWDWLKCAPLLVALTENGLEVVDGQSRATAGRLHPQITSLPAYVVDGSTLPQRADAFVSHARSRVAVTPGQIHRAGVTAGDAEAVAIDAACRAAGVRVLPYSPPFGVPFQVGDTVALASIRAMLARRGAERTVEILRALVAAGLAPITAQHLRAAEALLSEPEYAADFGPDQLTGALQAVGAGLTAEVKALAAAKGLPAWRAMVAVLFKHRGRARPRAAAHALLGVVDAQLGDPAREGGVDVLSEKSGSVAKRVSSQDENGLADVSQADPAGAGRAGVRRATDQGQSTAPVPNAINGLVTKTPPESTASPAPAKTDSKPVRTPEKGDYRASAPSAARPRGDRDSTAPLAPRRAVPVTAGIMGDPPPGRSALDQRRDGLPAPASTISASARRHGCEASTED